MYSTQDLTCLLCDILGWTLAEKVQICASICICWLFFPNLCFLPLEIYPQWTRMHCFIFQIFVLQLKWDILLDWFDSTVFSTVKSFFLTADGLYSREDGNRWRFPSPWLGLPGRHTCIEIICSKYRQGKRRAKIQISETNPSTWYNFQKIQRSFEQGKVLSIRWLPSITTL